MRYGRITRAFALAVVLAVIVGLANPSPAAATKSVTWTSSGKQYNCSVTANAPTLDTKTRYVTVSAKVVCTVSVTVSITMWAVEMDGTLVDATNLMDSTWPSGYKTSTLVGSKGLTFSYTIKRGCVSTETDYEEYATKAIITVVVSSISYTSLADYSVPKSNQYAC